MATETDILDLARTRIGERYENVFVPEDAATVIAFQKLHGLGVCREIRSQHTPSLAEGEDRRAKPSRLGGGAPKKSRLFRGGGLLRPPRRHRARSLSPCAAHFPTGS